MLTQQATDQIRQLRYSLNFLHSQSQKQFSIQPELSQKVQRGIFKFRSEYIEGNLMLNHGSKQRQSSILENCNILPSIKLKFFQDISYFQLRRKSCEGRLFGSVKKEKYLMQTKMEIAQHRKIRLKQLLKRIGEHEIKNKQILKFSIFETERSSQVRRLKKPMILSQQLVSNRNKISNNQSPFDSSPDIFSAKTIRIKQLKQNTQIPAQLGQNLSSYKRSKKYQKMILIQEQIRIQNLQNEQRTNDLAIIKQKQEETLFFKKCLASFDKKEIDSVSSKQCSFVQSPEKQLVIKNKQSQFYFKKKQQQLRLHTDRVGSQRVISLPAQRMIEIKEPLFPHSRYTTQTVSSTNCARISRFITNQSQILSPMSLGSARSPQHNKFFQNGSTRIKVTSPYIDNELTNKTSRQIGSKWIQYSEQWLTNPNHYFQSKSSNSRKIKV